MSTSFEWSAQDEKTFRLLEQRRKDWRESEEQKLQREFRSQTAKDLCEIAAMFEAGNSKITTFSINELRGGVKEYSFTVFP